ncbi:MAG TPA: homoserine kinase [Gemmatimonadaceae bacterium]|nr:homoserine kinase [Gemmatimonadaceae bacterium]
MKDSPDTVFGSGQRQRGVTATAPGGIGNIGPALDVLGCALAGPRDEVSVEWRSEPGIEVMDPGHPELPRDATRHTAALAAAAVLRRADMTFGLKLWCRKGLPLSGGQGGSAASAVAGAFATNMLLGAPLGTDALLAACLDAESAVAGRHLDNIAASLLGGIVLVRTLDPIEVIRLPIPSGLMLVLAHPAQRLLTVDSRRALPEQVSRADVIHQIGNVGAMVAACYNGDVALFGRAVDDRIAEPARAPLLPGFLAAKRAALDAGAYGVSISGAGPSAFAVASLATSNRVAEAMRAAYVAAGIKCETRVTHIDPKGAMAREDDDSSPGNSARGLT